MRSRTSPSLLPECPLSAAVLLLLGLAQRPAVTVANTSVNDTPGPLRPGLGSCFQTTTQDSQTGQGGERQGKHARSGTHLFAVLFPQQISEGAVGLLKGAQLLQEKFLLPRQGVDVGASHLFLLEGKHVLLHSRADRPRSASRGGGARSPDKRSWATGVKGRSPGSGPGQGGGGERGGSAPCVVQGAREMAATSGG